MLQSQPNLLLLQLVWDSFNVNHIAKHQVKVEEVEEVFTRQTFTLQGYKGRLLILGSTTAGRLLTVVIERLGMMTAYVVTARPMSKVERAYFEQEKRKSYD